MARTFIRQDTQIKSSDTYTDTTAPTLANYETNPAHIEDDLNALRSAVNYARKPALSGNWYDAQTAPTALETGTVRGVDDLNDALHAVEKKRVLKCIWGLKSISIASNGDTYDILGTGELPGNTTAAVGAVTTLGTVITTHGGTFGSHALDEVAGSTAISPKNLVHIVDASTRDPILDAGDRIYGLLQGETGVTDGATITDTTTTRVQISFVKVSSNDLVAITSGAMDGISYDYCYVERVRLEDLNEGDFLGNADVDVPAGSTVTRQVAYDNQGATPVDLTSNAILDLEGAGLSWSVRDDLEAALFTIAEGSAGGTSTITIESGVDVYQNDAADVDFTQGITVDEGGTAINLGITAGQIDAAAALTVTTTGANDMTIASGQELFLDDANQTGSTWAQTGGVKLSETTAEWDDYESAFGGEVSLLNAIVQAKNSSNRRRVDAVVTSTTSADADVSGPSNDNNIDTDLGDLSAGTFVSDYDIFLNGKLLRNGANAAANEDVYPGTALANGQLRFEFQIKSTGSTPDVITVIDHVS